MDIDDLLGPQSVLPALKARSKRQALEKLAGHAERLTGQSSREIFARLMEREKLGTTGVGQGVAIPHAKLPGLGGITGIFARVETPIDFDSVDAAPVDLLVLLLAPEKSGADHLKALARVSRLLRDRAFCEKLRGAENADALHALLLRQAAAA